MNAAVFVLVIPALAWGTAISALVSASRVSEHEWQLAHQSAFATRLGIVLTCGLGGIYYWLVVRPRLRRAAASAQEAALLAARDRASKD